MSEVKSGDWWCGVNDCANGLECNPNRYLFGISRERSEQYKAGYAARYEEEQQLTNQCEVQEK